ncbi:fatty acid desaturase 2 [Elysia marginata]|uniref:Fatty acid desaturase 2 n=1 Tax=Elysia marginata TaxID=1093978 RepID=A0AAV4IVS7_9GAST|nr:fatty acid desaturase 2 [Elysia marginata]
MGKGANATNGVSRIEARQITYEEFSKHNQRDDQWIMINGKAYDITEFAKRHPGGAKILNHFAGEDATDAWTAFHNDKEKVSKYLKAIHVGDIVDPPQAQYGWTQHDFGHHSVFKDAWTSHLFHHIVVGFLKGASSTWWNFRHFQHHAKPNRIKKDPDIDIAYLFLIGDTVPVEWGKKKRGKMPHQFQHNYFFFLGPPLLLPIYFHYEIIYFALRRRLVMYNASPVTVDQSIKVTFIPARPHRFFESHWFTWVTQMSHLPCDVSRDKDNWDWFTMQLKTTCNVDPGLFNDWFTGHLNYQIEHQ